MLKGLLFLISFICFFLKKLKLFFYYLQIAISVLFFIECIYKVNPVGITFNICFRLSSFDWENEKKQKNKNKNEIVFFI